MLRAIDLAVALAGLSAAASSQQRLLDRLHEALPTDPTWTEDVAVGDVDLDGDPDLFVGNHVHREALYLNDGTGVFADASHQLPPDDIVARAVGLGDLDGDGDLDALIVGDSKDRAWANSAGTFTEIAGAFPPGYILTSSLALGDVDADGDLDVLMGGADEGSSYGDPNQLHLNDGSGVFTDASAQLPTFLAGDTQAVAFLDYDLDGDPDALLGNFKADNLIANDGTGYFTDASGILGSLPEVTTSWTTGDVDGDGDIDALAGTRGTPRLHLNLGGPFGFVLALGNIPNVNSGAETHAVLLADADGDADLDAWIGKNGQNHLYLNRGTGVFVNGTSGIPVVQDWTRAVVAADFDGDADMDTVFGNYNKFPTRLVLNDGSGSFSDVPAAIPLVTIGTARGALADLDGDEDLDLVITNFYWPNGLSNRFLLNDGTGFFDGTTALPDDSKGTNDVAAADYDGDGDVDLFLGNGVGADQNRLLLNDGSALFTDVSATHLPAKLVQTLAVTSGDVDGDGDADIVEGNDDHPFCLVGAQNGLLSNDGTGRFSDATAQLPGTDDMSSDLVLGDLDSDGDLDLLVANAGCSGQQNRLHLNDGAGVFSDVTSTHLPADSAVSRVVALADVDLDGDLDAVVGNEGLYAPFDPNQLLLNQGGGVMHDAVGAFPDNRSSTLSAVMEDFDGDGDPDILFGNQLGQDRFYRNDGTGTFAYAVHAIPASLFEPVVLVSGDVDGDGDLDVWLSHAAGGGHVLSNLTRQVAWHNVASIGKVLAMDVYGPPNERWILVASFGTVEIDLPPFGTLYVDPATLIVQSLGQLDATGKDSPTYAVPADPALVGTTVHWQAAVGTSTPQLTNREATTFTDL